MKIDLSRGLKNVSPELRAQVLSDLRTFSNLSADKPLMPVPEQYLEAWAHKSHEIFTEVCTKYPIFTPFLNIPPEANIGAIKANAMNATDTMFEADLAFGANLRNMGVPRLYVVSALGPMFMGIYSQAADATMPPEVAQTFKQSISAPLMLRMGVIMEAYEAELDRFLEVTGMNRDLYENMLTAYQD